jgi:hypothetical protein
MAIRRRSSSFPLGRLKEAMIAGFLLGPEEAARHIQRRCDGDDYEGDNIVQVPSCEELDATG